MLLAGTLTTAPAELVNLSNHCNTLYKEENYQLVTRCFSSLLSQTEVTQYETLYLNTLSNYAYSLILSGDFNKSLSVINEAINRAEKTEHTELQAVLHGNMSIVQLHLNQYDKSYRYLTTQSLEKLPDNRTKQQLKLQQLNILVNLLGKPEINSKNIANEIIKRTSVILNSAETDTIYKSKALVLKSDLYLFNKQYTESERLLEQALEISQAQGLEHLLLRIYWKLANINKHKGNTSASLDYYSMAVSKITNSSIKLVSVSNNVLLNTQPVADLYREYADNILSITPRINDAENKQNHLQTARQLIESARAEQLKDYFKDDCVANTKHRLENIDHVLSTDSAVLYPVVFENRLELLLSTRHGIVQYTQYINRHTLSQLVQDLRLHLEKRRSRSYLLTAKKLYTLLIKPIEQALKSQNISTLVTIPSMGLQTLSFAALHDGEVFLIERYAIAKSPGLKLTEPGLSSATGNILLSGISEPVQGYPALNHVYHELNNINKHFDTELLINENFNKQSLSKALLNDHLSIAHIATHGEFGEKFNQSFLLAHNSKISFNQLSDFIGYNRFRDTPIDLLTLSACYTAAGSEKAALGLAGITVKSGAKSALASLWPVNDKATTLLMEKFYENLVKNTGKAEALRQAQLHLISDVRYRHPGYWAPFILIGNWE